MNTRQQTWLAINIYKKNVISRLIISPTQNLMKSSINFNSFCVELCQYFYIFKQNNKTLLNITNNYNIYYLLFTEHIQQKGKKIKYTYNDKQQ